MPSALRFNFAILLSFCLAYTILASIVVVSQPLSSFQSLDSIAQDYNNAGVEFAMDGDFAKASEFLLKSIAIRESAPNFSPQKLANGYLNLGNLKFVQNQVDSALFYYHKAETALTANDSISNSLLGTVYVQYGTAKNTVHDSENAIVYIKKGISLLSINLSDNAERVIAAYQKLANSYLYAGDYENAISAMQNASSDAEKFESVQLPQCLNNQAIIYIELKEYVKAVEILTRAESLFEQKGNASRRESISLYNNLGLAHWKLGNNQMAAFYFSKGNELINHDSTYSYQSAMLARNYGMLLNNMYDLNGAERFLLKALGINQRIDNVKAIANYSISDFYSPTIAIQCFEGLADVYRRKYKETESEQLAQKSFDYYAKAIELIGGLRLIVIDDSDRLNLNENYHVTFLKAIQWCFQIDEYLPQAIDYAFSISSKAKAFVLQQALAKAQGLEFSGVPPEVVEYEQRISSQIGATQEFIHNEKAKHIPNSKRLNALEDELFELKQEQMLLIAKIGKEYPNYFGLKYDSSPVSAVDIQKKLNKNQVFIDYILTDSSLISFAITKTHFSGLLQPIDSSFYENLALFFRELNPESFEALTIDNLNQFSQSSYFLYKYLLKPYQKVVLGKDLVIVPHLRLASVPFCALVTDSVASPKGYYSLPYLVNKSSVSYYPSAKLFLTEAKGERKLRPSAISFAPDYSQQLSERSFSSLPYRQYLSDLPGAEKEAKAVVRELKGRLALAGDANEEVFREAAKRFDILHLAMHTYIDEVNPLFSKLIFSHSPDTNSHGLISMYELYGLEMKSKLTIISACRSGDGTLVKGEGLLSLARGFQYAGSPSMVAAQWRVDDYSGAEVMLNFVRRLKRGDSKSLALQSAQVSFIEKADPLRSHPYFWASYQIIGSNSPLFFSNQVKLIMLLLLFALVSTALFFLWLRVIKKR